jgi:hypothetical protein
MRTFFFLLLLAATPLLAQPSDSAFNARIERSLALFDLKPFTGTQPPMRSRLGLYTNPTEYDTLWRKAGVAPGTRGYTIWHLMPHWSADEGGLYIGDVIVGVNGRPIGDSIYQNDDYMNAIARNLPPGDSIRFSVLRSGRLVDVPVRVSAARLAPMRLVEKPWLDRSRPPSWLEKTIAAKNIESWTSTINRQIALVADLDFSTVEFAGRPSPFRLEDITYLDHYPTRLGALSRSIVHDLWQGIRMTSASGKRLPGNGLFGALLAAAGHLDISLASIQSVNPLPATPAELESVAAMVQKELTQAYRPIAGELDSVTAGLVRVLATDNNWESELDSIKDPVRRRQFRTVEENRLAHLFAAADRVDFPSLMRAGGILLSLADTAWLRACAAAAPKWRRNGGKRIPGVEGEIINAWETPYGLFVIGGAGPNRYTADIRFLVDIGGNDRYELPALRPGTFRYIGDVAGNDSYLSSSSGMGAGVGGLDILVDVAGDDTYRGDRYSEGAGMLGIGVLADFAGDDIYTAHWCAQGVGFLGIGLLYEGGGTDLYNADIYAQGFGYTKGFGMILESGGNDTYRAGWKLEDSRYPGRAHIAMSQGFGFGMRPWSTGVGTDGGIGVLSDIAGHDIYASDFFSQGGSYWYALGILHDAEGCDRYTAGQYSQGSGIHLSFGALLDDAGDDMYDAYAGLEQGNAHDWSSGCLEDLAGNDTYRGSSSSQGSALTVAVAWLLDEGGNDYYYAQLSDTTHSQGGGNRIPLRDGGSLGLLLDLGRGTDLYTEPRVVPGEAVVKGNGMLFDDGVPAK